MPGNVAALRNLAIIARDQGDLDKALDLTRQGLAAAQGSPEELRTMHQLAAELYQRQGDTPALIAELEAIRQLDPNDAGTLQTLSTLYSAQGDNANALQIAQSLMALDPNNYQYPVNAGMALLGLERRDEALAMFQQAKTLAPAEQQAAIDALIQQAGGS